MTSAPNRRFRNAMLAGAAGLSLGLSAAVSAAPSVQLTFGVTRVALSAEFLGALGSLGVTPDNVLPGALYATGSGASVAFPIPTGELDADGPKLEILHSGGLTLTAGDTRVALTSFIIENLGGDLQLTGVVKANDSIVGRIPLFDIELTSGPELRESRRYGWFGRALKLKVRGAELTLAAPAATALNAVFGLDGVFQPGFPIGTAEIRSIVRDLDG